MTIPFESLHETLIKSLLSTHTDHIKNTRIELFNKIHRIAQLAMDKGINPVALTVMAISATQDGEAIDPVLLAYENETLILVIGITGEQLGDGENKFDSGDITCINQLAQVSEYTYEVGGE